MTNSDTYDDWGALFVGGNEPLEHVLLRRQQLMQQPEELRGDHVYPVVTINGLQVQRKIFVNPVGSLPGARILNLIKEPRRLRR